MSIFGVLINFYVLYMKVKYDVIFLIKILRLVG